MNISTFEALIVALLAIAPGYITIFFWSRNKMWRGLTNDLQTVLKALALSAVLQVAVSPLTLYLLYPVRNALVNNPWQIVTWLVVVVFIAPYLAGTFSGKLSDWLEERALLPEERHEHDHYKHLGRPLKLLFYLFPEAAPPSAWDSIFARDRPAGAFVIVEFKDGKQIAGAYGNKSEVFQSPEPHGLFLEEEWLLDKNGNIVRRVPDTDGILITDVSDVRCVRFLKEGTNGGDPTEPEAGTAA